MGFPTDALGVPTVANTSVLTSLTSINVAGISGSATPTTQIGVGANLPATTAIGDTQNVTVQVFDSLGGDHNLALTFTKAAQNQWNVTAPPPRGSQITVLDDPNGIPYRAAGRMDFDAVPSDGETVVITDAVNGALTFEFDTNAATTAGNIRVSLTGLTTAAEVATALQTAYTSFTGSYNATTETNNVGAFIPANIGTFPTPTMTSATTGISAAVDAIVQALPGMTAGSLQLDVEVTGVNTAIEFSGMAGLKYGIDGGAAGAAGADSGNLIGATTVELYVNDGTNDVLFATLAMGAAPTLSGGPDGTYGNITLDTFTRQTGDTRMTVGTGLDASSLFVQQGSATDGALTVDLSGMTVVPTNTPPAAITQATAASTVYTIPQATSYATAGIVFNSTGTPASFNVGSVDITYSNGAAASTGITLDFGTVGLGDAMTQFANDFVVYFINQNGVRFGSFNGVTIGEDGIVTALFDNGQSSAIFSIPLVTFPNPNGLFGKSGNAFAESGASGNGLLNTAATGSAGKIAAGSLEASTVDIATEFTNMIITQQAYSASARIITTADEMLDEVLRIAR